MPFVLLIIAITLLVAGGQNTQDKLFALVQRDFTQTPSFLPWLAALLAIGLLGYIDSIKSVMRAFLALVIIVILLHNRGFFAELQKAFKLYSPNAGQAVGDIANANAQINSGVGAIVGSVTK